MTENPQRPFRPLSNFKLRTAILYALPGVLMMGFGWYYGRPPALFLVCWVFLGLGSGALGYWKSKSKFMPPGLILVMMMGKPFMHRYFLGIPSWKVPLSIDLAGVGAWYLAALSCIYILKTARREPIQPQAAGPPALSYTPLSGNTPPEPRGTLSGHAGRACGIGWRRRP